MARKDLIPIRSTEEAKKRGQNGGLKSGESRRRKRALREYLEALLEGDRNGLPLAESIALALIDKALTGDVRAFEVIRDTIGEKPIERQNIEIQPQLTKEQRDAAFRGAMLTYNFSD